MQKKAHADVNQVISMSQSLQRKVAFSRGQGVDHSGKVVLVPIADFDLGRTIFSTLEGTLPRMVVRSKIANTVYWNDETAGAIETEYQQALEESPRTPIKPALIAFMNTECDFAVEHADGSFLEHLLFCYDYTIRHFPKYSPNVMLLHSILGTGTNTFAMAANKIPKLREMLTEFEMLHVEAFPSVLRLLYDQELLTELQTNVHRLDALQSIRFHRVIDNQPIQMSAEDFWIQLNYQMIHFVDFLPVANWVLHSSDPIFQNTFDLYQFLKQHDKLWATVALERPDGPKTTAGEPKTFGGLLSSLIPAKKKKTIAKKSIQQYSKSIDHSLEYTLTWA